MVIMIIMYHIDDEVDDENEHAKTEKFIHKQELPWKNYNIY